MMPFMNKTKKPSFSQRQPQFSQSALEPKISHEAIAKRAYEKFLTRGGSHGNHQQDWLEAERELRIEARRN